jgi:tetratricopeptide (TPR) repeat protein
MSLYARSGQPSAAVRQYRDCVRILEQELGVEPLDATTALYHTIQEQRISGAHAADRMVAEPTPDVTLQQVAVPVTYPLVGRDRELSLLMSAYNERAAEGHLAVVTGEAGVGKTRLVHAFLDQILLRGHGTLTLRCNDGESQLTLAPVIDTLKDLFVRNDVAFSESLPDAVLSEAGRLVPHLASSRPGMLLPAPLDSPGAQSRFFDALLDVFQQAVGGRGAIFVDDVQWIDGASMDLIAYLIRRLRGRPFLILAWRDDEIPSSHRLRGLLANAIRSGAATPVTLTRLNERDVEELASGIIGNDEAAHSLGEQLFEKTGGLPFFITQYLDDFRQHGYQLDDSEWPLPSGVRDILHARLASLSSQDAQVLTTLAVSGAATSYQVIQAASGRSEDEVVTALDNLIQRGLVSNQKDTQSELETLFIVSHDILRDLIYAETGLLRRRLLHRRIAHALQNRFNASARTASVARIAHHFRLAGDNIAAAESYRQAGDAATDLYANAEAVVHYEASLGLGIDNPALIHERIGDLRMRQGAYELAIASYERAIALSENSAIAHIEHKLANLYHRLGHWAQAETHFAMAESLLPAGDGTASRSVLARLIADRSLMAHRRGDAELGWKLGMQALDLAEVAGDERALAQSHNLLGVLIRNRDETAARHHLEKSLKLTMSGNNHDIQVSALNNLALLEHGASNHSRAADLAEQALSLAIMQGDRHHQAAIHSNLADFHYALGDGDVALEHLQASATIYADIGVIAGEHQAEIWKLTEW